MIRQKQLGLAVGCLSCFLLITGCQSNEAGKDVRVNKAVVLLEPTQNHRVRGMVSFTATESGVRIVADVEGLTPGKHGFHIHEKGDCSAPDASSAGGHFNPTNLHHGAPDVEDRHLGDLGNLEADSKGYAHYDRIDKVIVLHGANSIVGKAVIVHEKEDDLTSQPVGNAGGRVACGVIEVAN